MARVTIEDCVLKVPNRFELVVYASQRTRQISAGAPLTVERDNNKNQVVALHEIANGRVDVDSLKESVIKSFRLNVESDFQDDELSEIFAQDTSAQFFGVDRFENKGSEEDSGKEFNPDMTLTNDSLEDSNPLSADHEMDEEDVDTEETDVDLEDSQE